MGNLIDEDFYKRIDGYNWWKSKWILYNLIMIPIGLILLYIEYRYYKNASLNEMVFYKGTVISFLTVFAFLALIAGNIFYLIYGRQLKKKNVSNDIDYLMKQFRMSLFYAFIIELLFFLLGLSMASTFTLFLSI